MPFPLDTRAAAARAWRDALQESACDSIKPWQHGRVVRATGYPTYWNFNAVCVADDANLGVDELVELADRELGGLSHRRIDFDVVETGERLRPAFTASGWEATRLVWMRYERSTPPAAGLAVTEVDYDAVRDMRLAWLSDDYGDGEFEAFLDGARELAQAHRPRVLAAIEGGIAAGFSQIERLGDDAEVALVYVRPAHRGRGLGTQLTIAAIRACAGASQIWICADDEGRPKHLYERLGFRPAWTMLEFLRRDR